MVSSGALLVLACFCLSTHAADKRFIMRDCAAKDHAFIELKSASVSPHPVKVPGEVTASGQVQVYKDAANASLRLQVDIQHYLGFFWVTVPCISEVGSCTYDACDLLSQLKATGCPQQMVEDNIPCTCDTIKAGVYDLTSKKFAIPELTGVWSWLAAGDYKVDMKLVDKTTNQEVGCLHAEVSIAECEGFLCSIFG